VAKHRPRSTHTRIGLTVALLVATISVVGHDAVAAESTSPYWLAGWLPKHEQLINASSPAAPNTLGVQNVASYARTRSHEDIQIYAYPNHRADQVPKCNPDKTTRRAIRGHPGCANALVEDGPAYGTSILWQERPDLLLNVLVYRPLTAADARRIAEHVKPTDATTWHRLVTSTSLITQADPTMRRIPAGTGTLDRSPWVLTALIPKGYPLGPEDHRGACDELSFRGERGTTCTSSGRRSRFIRLAGKVFVFGSVPSAVQHVSVHLFDPSTGGASGHSTSTPQLATADTQAAKPARTRFFATPLPDDNCGVYVFDADHPATQVGFAPGLPFDAVCAARYLTLPSSPPAN